MFLRQHDNDAYFDLSKDLHDPQCWSVEQLRCFDFPLNISSVAIEPVSGLLAAGTSNGLIYIYGGPAVELKLTLPDPVGVSFVNFALQTSQLVCLDDNSQLHIWDLSEARSGKSKYMTRSRFDKANSVSLSASHEHVFVATRTGEIRTYDLASLRKSPYTLPNMWKLYEDKLVASGLPMISAPGSLTSVEVVIHPRDLNLLFVAYAGGVVLADLSKRSTIGAYELVIPPGAPGGAGYAMDDILTHRRPAVTAIAVHPTGHFFAVGYVDGSIAFWAVDDDSQPILVRTLDSMDVNLVDENSLEVHLEEAKTAKAPQTVREPIFKLSWSGFSNSVDPRGGDTIITVLGGLDTVKGMGLVIIHLPPFNPPEPPASDSATMQGPLHPFLRAALRRSLDPIDSFFYATQYPVHDYLLVPLSSPHFSGSFDPYAILLMTEAPDGSRLVEAYQFPPPSVVFTKKETPSVASGGDAASSASEIDHLADRMATASIDNNPQRKNLPDLLSIASSGLVNGLLTTIQKDVYNAFLDESHADIQRLTLKGGVAWPDDANKGENKLSKYQLHRILVTYHRDLTVKFHDMSPQLLLSSPIDHYFPEPLPQLTVDIKPLLTDNIVLQKAPLIAVTSIHSVHLATEALECAVVLHTGEIIVWKPLSSQDARVIRDIPDDEITILEHIHPYSGQKLSPYLMFTASKGKPTACAISNSGFLAMSYEDGSLFVIDMRGPTVILRPMQSKKHKKTPSLSFPSRGHFESGPDPITSLSWTVSPLAKDIQLRVRLIAMRSSGHVDIYTLLHSSNPPSWTVTGDLTPAKGVSDPLPGGIFVLDSKTGKSWRADQARLAASLTTSTAGTSSCIFVAVGAKGARSTADINGERIAKVEWGQKAGRAQTAQIVEKTGYVALVVVTETNDALVYSLPHLNHVHTMKPFPATSLPAAIDGSGDFIAFIPHPKFSIIQSASYGTFFGVRRIYDLPDIDFLSARPSIPNQPQPVSLGPASLMGTWFNFTQTLSGEQVDELLGGPDRPIIERKAPTPRNVADSGSGAAGATDGIMAAATAAQEGLYNRLASALGERGQMLGDLEDRFNSLEEGSKNMVAQAKRLAAEQTAKGWFGLR